MGMDRWVVEATTAVACCDGPAATLEGLGSCSIIRTYLASMALAVAWTPYDVSATPAMSGYTRTVQGPAMAMGRWIAEATTALACPAQAATTLEGLRSSAIVMHT